MNEQTDHSTAMSDVIATLVDIVKAGVAKRPDGVHLTWVGGEFAKIKKASFEQYVNHVVISDGIDIPLPQRKMALFIREYCNKSLTLKETSNQNYLVNILNSPSSEDIDFEPIRINNAQRRFKKGIWPAFIRPIAAGKHRYIDIERFLFSDEDTLLHDSHLKEVRQPFVAGIPVGDPFNTADVEDLIEKWCAEIGVPIESLTASAPIDTAPTLLDLARIIRSLPASLSASWMIPADVLRHLK